MRGVQLHDVEPGLEGAAGGVTKGVDDRHDAGRRQRTRCRIVRGKRLGSGADWLPSTLLRRDRAAAVPWPRRARLSPGVRELRTRQRLLRVDEADAAREPLDVRVLVDPEVLRADAAVGGNGGRLRHHQRRAAGRARAEVHEVPVIRKTVDARVLAHRRDDDAVREGQSTKRQRIEQVRHGHILARNKEVACQQACRAERAALHTP
jgi:hypothetical protein